MDSGKALRISNTLKITLKHLNKTTSKIVNDALTVINNDLVGSIPGALKYFEGRRTAIKADIDLSENGKNSQIRSAAVSTMSNLSGLAKRIVGLEELHNETKKNAIKIEKADVPEVLVDLELLKHIKSADMIPMKLMQLPERLRVALVRNPVELSGIKPEVQDRILGSLISPDMAVQLSEEAEALESARLLMQTSINELAPISGLTPREMVEHFGNSWQLPGVVDSLMNRLASNAKNESAGEALV